MRRIGLAALCLLAFALSWAYLQHYLRGGPRIIDATSYWLEARSLANGSFTFHVPEPTASFRGRFLLAAAGSDGHELGVLFPPGYPALLALGMRLGLPLLVGPSLAALLVAATYGLARALEQPVKVAFVAAALSALCGALRYHTADTMSHGLATLLACCALLCVAQRELRNGALLSGLCLGLLIATRPVSALAPLLLGAYAQRRAPRSLLPWALGMIPGIFLLLAQQHALTGSPFGSLQLAYYAASDAPAGCFRYGFGAGIGCRFEHGDYVSYFLPNGFGARHALRNLWVHLSEFATDATNTPLLTLLAGYTLARNWRSPLGWLGVGIALQALAYVPFYFDGNYPGGGARFLCEAIPLCQILVARAACDWRVGAFAPAAAALAFSLFGHRAHDTLSGREGGRPMFEPALLERAHIQRGLVFVDTDHGFNLGYQPGQNDPRRELVVARRRGDAHDRQLFEALGRPRTFRYRYDLKGRTPPAVEPYLPPLTTRFEAEAEWPTRLERGSAYPRDLPCASAERGLRLLPGTRAVFDLGRRFYREEAPQSEATIGSEVQLGWFATTSQGALVRAGWVGETPQVLSLTGPGCSSRSIVGPPPGAGTPFLVELVSGEGGLDFLAPTLVTR